MLLGDVAEWLRSGLQSRLHRFDSGRRLHEKYLVRGRFPTALHAKRANIGGVAYCERLCMRCMARAVCTRLWPAPVWYVRPCLKYRIGQMGRRYAVSLVGSRDWREGRYVFVDERFFGTVWDGPSLVVELEGDGHKMSILKRLPAGLEDVPPNGLVGCHVSPEMIKPANIDSYQEIDDWGNIEYVFEWSTRAAYTLQAAYAPAAMAFLTKWPEPRYVKFVGGVLRPKSVRISPEEYRRMRGTDGPVKIVKSDMASIYPGDALATAVIGGHHAAVHQLGDLTLTQRDEVLFRFRQTVLQRAVIGSPQRFAFHLPRAKVAFVKPGRAGMKKSGIVISADGRIHTVVFMGRHPKQAAEGWRSLLETQQT
jgi:hypothetical protein